MTISQSSSNQGSNCAGTLQLNVHPLSAASFGRFIHLALVHWRERRRAKADLARLAEGGDHLLLDVGLDPWLARQDPGAVLDLIVGDRPVAGERSGGQT